MCALRMQNVHSKCFKQHDSYASHSLEVTCRGSRCGCDIDIDELILPKFYHSTGLFKNMNLSAIAASKRYTATSFGYQSYLKWAVKRIKISFSTKHDESFMWTLIFINHVILSSKVFGAQDFKQRFLSFDAHISHFKLKVQ
uniref:Uncharacterized protein n=1 Tax=Rhipicephalus microplus TaxID=6941 RepID=A0A6G5AIE3_RHIMP